MKKKIVYHGMKGERIIMDKPSKRQRLRLHAESYEHQRKKDFMFAIVFCFAVALGCLLIIINT